MNEITRATCVNCGRVTLDRQTLEIMNDLDPTCLGCGVHFVAWFIDGGFNIVITKEQENQDVERIEISRNGVTI